MDKDKRLNGLLRQKRWHLAAVFRVLLNWFDNLLYLRLNKCFQFVSKDFVNACKAALNFLFSDCV